MIKVSRAESSSRGFRNHALIALLFMGVLGIENILPVYAGTYKVKCDDVAAKLHAKTSNNRIGTRRPTQKNKCKMIITVSADEISSPSKTIPTTRVTSWVGGGDSKTNVGLGAATTILLGPIGLLGFLAKNHVYSYTVNGFDRDGNRESIVFEFKDKAQPGRLMRELPIVTGLAFGQSRSEMEIKQLEEGGGKIEPELIEKYEEDTLYGKPAEQDTVNSKCGRVIQDYDCSYDSYLEANPPMQAWAEANPEMANKERIRLKSLD